MTDYNGRKALEWITALNKISGRPVLTDDHDQPYPYLLKAIRETYRAINKAGRRLDYTLDDLPLPK